MVTPVVALVAVASPVESGGDRGVELINDARTALENAGLTVVGPTDVVWGVADSGAAMANLGSPDLLVIVHLSWVVDSLQFELVRALDAPVLLWALPYPETFSLASVKHFSSVAASRGVPHRWGYGEVSEPAFAARVTSLSHAAATAKRFRSSRVALLTSRSTWRTAGPQDTTYDEWDLAQSLGATTIHLPVEELILAAELERDDDAAGALERHRGSFGALHANLERATFSAKVYLAARKLMGRYDLDALAVACYPAHFGLVNLAASWLADEGVHLDPEGDVGHSLLANAMLALDPRPVALAEPVLIDAGGNRLFLRHEGSSPASLAVEPAQVEVGPLGEALGLLVEFPMRPIETLTVASLCGRDGKYGLWAGRMTSPGIPPAEWRERGRGFLAAISPLAGSVERLVDVMFDTGMDHHLLLQEGDRVDQLADLALLWGAEFIALPTG